MAEKTEGQKKSLINKKFHKHINHRRRINVRKTQSKANTVDEHKASNENTIRLANSDQSDDQKHKITNQIHANTDMPTHIHIQIKIDV